MSIARSSIALAMLALVACPGNRATTADGGDGSVTSTSAPFDATAIARAEDLRRAKDIPPEAHTNHDPIARRRTARALARIADTASLEGLGASLADEDPETVTWGAYGLGYACKGHEEAHVKALAARAVSLPPPPSSDSAELRKPDSRLAIARAVGRCGGTTSERVLVGFVKAGGAWSEAALLGLGDLATRRKQLGPEAMTALLEAKTAAAFYALSRAEQGEAFGERVVKLAIDLLPTASTDRIFVIKALGRAPKPQATLAAGELARVVSDPKAFTIAERAEAARGLGALGEPGISAAGDVLGKIAPPRDDQAAIKALGGAEFNVLYTLLIALGPEPPKKAQQTVMNLSNLAVPDAKPALARRLAELRCAAALGLARAVHDAEVIMKCDVAGSEIRDRARLTSLGRRPIDGDRLKLFRTFAKSESLRVREQAVEAITEHQELRDAAAQILAEALTSKKAGLVAVAAEVVHTHPERAQVLAESEKRAALDPHAPPPSANPAQELSKEVQKALGVALAEKWPEDRFETRLALMEAAAAVHHPQAKAVAQAACNDANIVVRERAQKALRSMGETVTACGPPPNAGTPAPEIASPRTSAVKIAMTTDAGVELGIVLDPELAPVTVTRIASLVESGFYKGILVHRVVPGFVAQFGDPDGDGYGGSGTSLRCETSPVPFNPLDVGMALAGRDTGSSQIFVTLSRTPHLDGEYTRVGHATGDWAQVAQGDVIADAKITHTD